MTEPIGSEPDGWERDPQRDGSTPDVAGQGLEHDRWGQVAWEADPKPHASDADASATQESSGVETSGNASRRDVDSASADSASSDSAGVDSASTDSAGVDNAGVEPAADDPDAANKQVADALAELDAAADWPPADQVAAFTAAHETLQATLARIDDH